MPRNVAKWEPTCDEHTDICAQSLEKQDSPEQTAMVEKGLKK